jgi:magnesium-transporting ATPase (P-type)
LVRAGKPSPLSPMMMLWVNFIMDSFGALALGTEAPSLSLLDRRPYKTSCSLVSRPMWRNILVQSIFQLILLLVIMFKGPLLFDTHDPSWCSEFHLDSPSAAAAADLLWDPYTGQQQADSPNATISCLTFRDVCESRSGHCFDSEHDIVAEGLGTSPGDFSFEDLAGFRRQCLDCVSKDKTLASIIFNTFVFCQIFNEFNSRSIFNKWNVISGLHRNPIFMGVITITIVVQIIFIQCAGKFFWVRTTQWPALVAVYWPRSCDNPCGIANALHSGGGGPCILLH